MDNMDYIDYEWAITWSFDQKLAGMTGGLDHRNPCGIISDPHGSEFKMLADGHLLFEGVLVGCAEHDGTEPLEDFGAEHGCDEIQYKQANGEWNSLQLEEAA